jgi:hypothetical protein
MADVAGKAEHIAGRQLVALAGDEDRHPPVETGEELARAGKMGRPGHDRSGPEFHHLH